LTGSSPPPIVSSFSLSSRRVRAAIARNRYKQVVKSNHGNHAAAASAGWGCGSATG
jgi:hypothetical protein